MKFKKLAIVTLALGLLTTGVIASEGQVVQAKENQERVQHLYDIRDLHQYYSAPSFEYSNISSKVENYNGSNVLRFNQKNQNHQLFLLGKDKEKYKEGFEGQDVFVVQELIDPNGRLSTVGGVTKKNVKSVFGFVSKPDLLVKKTDSPNGMSKNELFLIKKEEVSLKELDFKIRKLLVEKHGLYQGKSKYGKIIINLKNDKKEEIDLSNKLQFERMGDVLDSKDIKNIEVNLN
ncbi:TPA: superantigen-like protein SSL7 [Staphylococcus aureus]|uniref:superantigen-like protein SSL7 n=5 Tax=Staphylococcus aureus TaxID=1280 RepID=UPI0005C26E53|nr:superantigen-like protein SSL7 [Staphylococcus aureus]HDH6408360.1 superantigen-like protein SSL7 [Staphylococcus aureus MRSA-Lux-40]AJP21649.1 superantigen-like protein [Staphylococcus aureus]ATZ15831.1 superantigen-like protein SSL7 [Staphylococcus aureus]EJX2101767.1 superantigen-like protein SSL7 [Staphylococcus aureus]EKF1404701.1 superantigen-like protein SSL7 [Staphylococcus aureus]